MYGGGGDLSASPSNTGINSPGQGSLIVNNQGGPGNPNLPSNLSNVNNSNIINNTGGNNNALPLSGSQQQGQGPPNLSPGQGGNNIEGGQGQVQGLIRTKPLPNEQNEPNPNHNLTLILQPKHFP